MRIAIPVTGGRLSMHFGHCGEFTLVDVDPDKREVLKKRSVPAPSHQRGTLPWWLAEEGAEVIIAGGMGGRAQGLFKEKGVQVVVGIPEQGVDALVKSFLEGRLSQRPPVCDHSEKPCHDDG